MESFSLEKTDLFRPLLLGATARETLQEFADIDVTAEDLVRILKKNQAYRELFSRFVNQKTKGTQAPSEDGKKQPESPTHRLIGLLGMMGSRNLILSLRMHKCMEGKFPINEDGNVEVQVSNYLKRAIDVEEIFLKSKLEYSETAYTAGVYYDWIQHTLSKHPQYKKILEPYCTEVWNRAFRTGVLAYFLAKNVVGVSPKHAMAAGFFLHGGKIFLASTFPEYPEWEKTASNPKLTLLGRKTLELKRFGFNFEEVSAHTLFYFDVFPSLREVISMAREPFYAKGKDSALYKFAALLYLAEEMAQSWKIPANEKDPVFQEWAHPSLKQLKLNTTKLMQIMKSAMTLK
jgi:hypothetical protein